MQPAEANQLREQIEFVLRRAPEVRNYVNECVVGANESVTLSHNANTTAMRALQGSHQSLRVAMGAVNQANRAVESVQEIRGLHEQMVQLSQGAAANLTAEFDRLREAFTQEVVRNEQARLQQNELNQRAKINEKQRLGIFEQEARIKAQGVVEAEKEKWEQIEKMIKNPELIGKIILTIVVAALGIYTIKHGMPLLFDHLTQPRIVSETSKTGWFGWSSPVRTSNIDGLIFTPGLQSKLFDLALRVKTSKEFNESLPNVLFHGPSGTGKTAFAKELAYWSGLDYAITSGSEFAKITDLSLAIKELRKLVDWGKASAKGLIIFIDEAESLFANRLLSSTSKTVQDFINAFLSLVPEKSQKNIMFIFATNHPFKLDDAIISRVGITIEFTAPEQEERVKILGSYLEKFGQENKKSLIDLPAKTIEKLSVYAQELKGFVPRAIKFAAEEMIVRARRNNDTDLSLTDEIAREVVREAKANLAQAAKWEVERQKWVKKMTAVAA